MMDFIITLLELFGLSEYAAGFRGYRDRKTEKAKAHLDRLEKEEKDELDKAESETADERLRHVVDLGLVQPEANDPGGAGDAGDSQAGGGGKTGGKGWPPE